ncbi:hypothetical protein AVEN_168314-1 [Araneus ventricosus]|uniref:Uncharacterized protein n=1 Tax=Araneus ventricosus TaxID=182803 RepID=A0A4Y2HW37_ARAVE|nr:hypothetical protein AVEN_168314-1 [Araneus ventricosus]
MPAPFCSELMPALLLNRPVGRGPRWPSGKASASGRRGPDSKPDCTEDPPCMWACCMLNNSEVAKRPPACMLRRFGEMVPAQVSSLSSDNGSKLRGPPQNNPRDTSIRDVNITKPKSVL